MADDIAPDLDAILDSGLANEPDAPADDTPEPAAAEPATEATEPAAEPEPEPAPEGEPKTYDEKYVRELREESARYRTRAKEFNDVFDGINDGDREAILGFAQMYKDDPKQAAAWMRANADALDSDPGKPEPEGEDKPLTRAEFDKLIAEREAATTKKQQADQAVANINKQMDDLGYPADSVDRQIVMLSALEQHNGDIPAAHAAHQAAEKAKADKIIADYLAGKQAAADGPTPTPPTGAAAPADKPIRNVKDAGSAFEAHLEALRAK